MQKKLFWLSSLRRQQEWSLWVSAKELWSGVLVCVSCSSSSLISPTDDGSALSHLTAWAEHDLWSRLISPILFIFSFLFFNWNINVTMNKFRETAPPSPCPSSALKVLTRTQRSDQAAHVNGCQVIVAHRYGDGARARWGSWKEVWKTQPPITVWTCFSTSA